jgi:RNA polymerase sigma-70 factor (family 1)
LQTVPPYAEKELLLRVSEGSEDAFAHLFQQYRGKLYHYILTITESKETAEDTVHDVFLKIWINREKLPAIENLNSYLYMMSRNEAISGLRRMAKETLIMAELQKNAIGFSESADIASQNEVKKFITLAIEKLSPQQRKVFILNRQEGLKHEQIADQLGISINTVRTHLAKATQFLRDEIGQRYGPLTTAIIVLHKLS